MTLMEIRGRGSKWIVSYPDESGLASTVDLYDQEGIRTGTFLCAGPTGKMVEAHFEGTQEEAEAYARYLGATEIKTARTKTKAQSLALARKARSNGAGNHESTQDAEIEPERGNPSPGSLWLFSSSQRLCRSCGKEIPSSGKRGRPPVKCEDCR